MSVIIYPLNQRTSGTRWRYAVFLAVSVAIWAVGFAINVPGRPYDPNRLPDAIDFTELVSSNLLLTGLYGLLAVVPLIRGSASRSYFAIAIAIGVVFTAFSLWFEVSFAGIDCEPSDCVPAVPHHGFIKAAYAVSLIPAVVLPALLAFVRWPKSDDGIAEIIAASSAEQA